MKKFFYILLVVCQIVTAQKIARVEPLNWWAGMENNQVQLMVYGNEISDFVPKVNSADVKLVGVTKTGNKNYLFVELDFSKAKAQKFEIVFKKKGFFNDISITYELKERKANSKERVGFDSSDAIYLITPDRFVNGDPSNDSVKGLQETKVDRSDRHGRHGGDIRGIINSLDYIEEMGFTAIWPTPMLINDMATLSYHGYAMTDLYKVDPRFGTLEEYKELSEKLRAKDMKLIMDQVANHIGLDHWWMKDLPAKDWVNYQAIYESGEKVPLCNHKRTINQDSYASNADAEGFSDGWFTYEMPDLNQRNPLLAKYIIQNSIWWVETLDLGGIRQDTYSYPDKYFMSNWCAALLKEYPNFSIVGEEWSINPLLVGYWQQGIQNRDGYEPNLPSSMDFPMQVAVADALKEDEKWNGGLVKIYEALANDFYYPNPSKILAFPDNHDMSRIFTQVEEDPISAQMAVGFLLTLPRIPQLYYGTEILMDDTENPGDHGLIRTDFPGGWKGDKANVFTDTGLTEAQAAMRNFTQKVLNFRKNSNAIHKGKTIHFAPEGAIYVLFRVFEGEKVAVILNKNKESVTLDLNRFKEIGLDGKMMKNVVTGEEVLFKDSLKLTSKGITILSIKE